jgi:hypothetical protein
MSLKRGALWYPRSLHHSRQNQPWKKIIHDDSTKCEEKILEFQALKQAEKCTATAESRV